MAETVLRKEGVGKELAFYCGCLVTVEYELNGRVQVRDVRTGEGYFPKADDSGLWRFPPKGEEGK